MLRKVYNIAYRQLKNMPKITIAKGNMSNFSGDAIVVPCDADLTYKKGNAVIQHFSDVARNNDDYRQVIDFTLGKIKESEKKLLKELSSIGYCELGNAIITKAYLLGVKNFIFMPFFDHDDQENKMNFVMFHQALRSVFNLASIYGVKTLAIPLPSPKFPKEEVFTKFVKSLFEITPKKGLRNEEMMNIIMGVSEEYKNTPLENVTIYR